MVPGGSQGYIFKVKVETVKLIGGRRYLAAMSGLNGRVYSNSNGLDDFKVALYVCQNHTDDGIYSDHGYLDIMEIPLGPP